MFDDPFLAPVTQGSWGDRANLREAQRLLHEAGWSLDNQDPADKTCGVVCRAVRVTFAEPRPPSVRNDKGETLDVEFLTNEPSFERIIAPFVRNLRAIGIRASIRRVDSAQYERRVKSLDFDIITTRFSMRLTPGVELKDFFSSESARMDGTRNLAGIASPVVDAMVDKVLEADTREELVTATHALDRVLRVGALLDPALVQGLAQRSPSGTNSAGRASSRSTPAASRKPGGTMRKKLPNSRALASLRRWPVARAPGIRLGALPRSMGETRTARLIGWDNTS